MTKDFHFPKDSIKICKMLSNPNRFRIIILLYPDNKLNVTEIINTLNLPPSYVSQQLSKMRGNMLEFERKGHEIYYYIEKLKVKAVIEILLN
ncbi:metalloregulator ArsR/SmtB family transcription factor [Bacillus sp. TH13]|uniref:ArsR/SmtB family transcription factor n=1 Tax=Bacillus sp. TH13 TaxID=2796379 RepID=UPI0019112FDE|nr:metalloregulator ArsR/SmtB family transcription factor [Bacillus sp. TH13]MBK5491808.1 winged helix-turn-helix transcriptional regulator [Bacillus sp. TH13]